MLYITRKKGESIIINNDITLTIVEVIGNKVKIGCDFPPNSSILRSELYEKIKAHNQSSLEDIDIEDLTKLEQNTKI